MLPEKISDVLGLLFSHIPINPQFPLSYPSGLLISACSLGAILTVHSLRKDAHLYLRAQRKIELEFPKNCPSLEKIFAKAVLATSFTTLGISTLFKNTHRL